MDKLQEQGWYLNEQGWNIISASGSIADLQKLSKRACDTDLREIGSGQGDITNGNIILQIQKLKNIAAPKGNEESRSAPRMLKLSLTDGKNNYQAVEIEKISGLSLDTPPGTKILLKSGEIVLIHGIVLLGPANIAKVLGGKVTNLVEKWELNRKLATHSRLRSVEEGGPPPWIPFGKKIMKGGIEGDKNFKALGAGKDATDKEATEFEAQRQDAIAEAARLGGKKVFGGGNKQLLDHSVQKIVDQGFSVEQAEFALKMNRNNIDRALKSLQRTSDNRFAGGREPREPRELRPKRFEKKPEDTKPSSGKVSLFDFLEDKLPAQTEAADNSHQSSQPFHYHNQQQQQQQQQHQHQMQRLGESSGNYRLENHFERLEMRGSEYSQAGKGGRAQKGGRGHQTSTRQSSYETKFSKRPTADSYNPFATTNPTFGNSHQAKAPRFQRNQEPSTINQPDNAFKGNYGRPSQTNERKIINAPFGQSRNEFASTNSESYGTQANKNRDEHRSGGRINHNVDRYHAQQSEVEQKIRQVHEAGGQNRHNRIQQDSSIQNRPHSISNTTEKISRNDNIRPQQSIATNDREMNNHGNCRNLENEFTSNNWAWKVGDDCMAKYWEDNRYYNAQVTAVSARTCVVLFKDFHNYEEVLQVDCIPITDKFEEVAGTGQSETRRGDDRGYGGRPTRYDQTDNHISPGMEFRRGGGASGGPGGNVGLKGYNRKRGQQRSAQAIYQPPAQRGHSSVTWTPKNNPAL